MENEAKSTFPGNVFLDKKNTIFQGYFNHILGTPTT
jgi:hypothetical protein